MLTTTYNTTGGRAGTGRYYLDTNSVIPAPPPTRTAVSSYAGDGEAASGVKNNKKKGWMMRWEYDDVIKEEKRRR